MIHASHDLVLSSVHLKLFSLAALALLSNSYNNTILLSLEAAPDRSRWIQLYVYTYVLLSL